MASKHYKDMKQPRIKLALRRISRSPLPLMLISLLLLSFLNVPSVYGASQDIRIASHSHYIDRDGFLHVVGEVENNYNKVINNVKVVSVFSGPENDTITTKVAHIFIDNLRPRERSPFSIVVTDMGDVGNIASYRLTAITLQNQPATTLQNQPAKALPASLRVQVTGNNTDENGLYHVSGKIVNYGNQTATKLGCLPHFITQTAQ